MRTRFFLSMVATLLAYKPFLVISFDPVLASTLRIPVELFRTLMMILLAFTIVISIHSVGVGLVAAMLVTPGLLMVSGTASIVGHATRHAGDVRRQLAEIFSNLDSLLSRARAHAPALPPLRGGHTLIKAYLRDRSDLPVVEQALRERLPPGTPFLVLAGDVCRGDLLVELDCLHSTG